MKSVITTLGGCHFFTILTVGVLLLCKLYYFEKRYSKEKQKLDSIYTWLKKEFRIFIAAHVFAIIQLGIWNWYLTQPFPDFWVSPWAYLLMSLLWLCAVLFGFCMAFEIIFWSKNMILSEIENEKIRKEEKLRNKKPSSLFRHYFFHR